MARQDNPFDLLVDDDEGGDVSTLLARVEARISLAAVQQKLAADADPANAPAPAPAPTTAPTPTPKPEHVVRGERGRGRGGSRRDAEGQYGGEEPFRGRGRGRGGRGLGGGRGRGFYEGRAFGNENRPYNTDKQAQAGEVFVEGAEGKDKDGVFSRPHPPRYGNGYGDENRNREWDERRYDGGHRPFRGGRGGRGRGYAGESCGYRGGRGSFGGGSRGRNRGGEGRDGGGYSEQRNGDQGEVNQPESKEESKELSADVVNAGEEQVGNTAHDGDGASGCGELPETTVVPKDAEPEKPTPEKEKTEEELEAEEDAKKMTLGEYEKLLHEKRKALEALKTEERKVVVDKEFEGMQLVEKKKEEELFIKLKVEKDKLKKKDSFEKEEKVRKLVSIDLFVKPAEGEGYSGRGNYGRGRGRGRRGRGDSYSSRGGRGDGYRGGPRIPAPSIEDPSQFPLLGEVVKA